MTESAYRCRLSPEERQFAQAVQEATAANPFLEERERIDREVAALSHAAPPDEVLQEALSRVGAFVHGLEREQRIDIRRYPPPDREALRVTLLFFLFHQFAEDMDQLIVAQEQSDDPLEVPFAEPVLERMRAFGLSREEALRAFAIFYQLRRAFYFIHRGLIGTSPCMKAMRAQLWNNVFTYDFHRFEHTLWNRMEDFSTLLLGETGTGKGAAAAAIGRSGFVPFDPAHRQFAVSFRASFIETNLSQFSEGLIESELFGHRKGAFTGAIDRHEGIFARCRPNGAIFLDEIGELSVPVQIRLLRVLQERVFSPVGSHELRRFGGRVIAATNRPIEDLRRGGTFREDFYYRLCSDVITIPPLRRRIHEDAGELPLLVATILDRLCGPHEKGLDAGVVETVLAGVGPDYAWPGNVRELEQAVRRVLLRGTYESDAGSRVGGQANVAELVRAMEQGGLTADQVLARYCGLLYQQHGSFSAVARVLGLDPRTARKHVLRAEADAAEHQ